MTRFGEYLENNLVPEWRQHYVRYKLLKQILGEIVLRTEAASGGAERNAGLATTPPGDLAHLSLTFARVRPGGGIKGEVGITEGAFFEALDKDVGKVRDFVESSLARLRARVEELDVDIEECVR